ncbi:hypothetical protein [Rhodothermus profundi]|uniref:Uncharacterized protein n=1 Tax=Rhodothermus profundi TaxID=633813 RepID=A0A1M6RCV6_9BACT|nr:hypothetical protein [Rhodothermus profundi]SHK30178.1 hypothetical protein SAMN04488087_0790 [Rhodothermus profundi]
MKRTHVRRLFWGLAILLPIQYALVGLVQLQGGHEPWPLLVMPGFKATWQADSPLLSRRVTFVVHQADGTMQPLPADAVLASLPYSHHRAMLEAFFQPASLSGTPETERIRRPDAIRWLWNRMQALTGDTPVQVDIVWEQLRFTPHTGTLQVFPLDTLTIRQP